MLHAILNMLTVKNIGRREVVRVKTIRNLGCDVVRGEGGTNRICLKTDTVGSFKMPLNCY